MVFARRLKYRIIYFYKYTRDASVFVVRDRADNPSAYPTPPPYPAPAPSLLRPVCAGKYLAKKC